MYFILEGHSYSYEVQTTIQIFYQNLKYTRVSEVQDSGITVLSTVSGDFCTSAYYKDGVKIEEYKIEYEENELRRFIKLSVFNLLQLIVPLETPWGILTGIRPAKKARELLIHNNIDEVKRILNEKYLVATDKADLSIKVALAENDIIKNNNSKAISLYIGIPFCTTRCLYCSFTAYPIAVYKNKVSEYLTALFKELEYVASLPYDIENIYIGGGTPTSLDEFQLEKLLSKVNELFNVENTKEFTLECGRPDTLNRKKLSLAKMNHVSRISINPQTLIQKTLGIIGREHTVEDFYRAFSLAREEGNTNINTDLILGLPDETLSDVNYTLDGIRNLSPESITVHTLAIKRASALKRKLDEYSFTEFKEMEKMLSLARETSESMAMHPYYMYRQKNMTGNFENIGYSKKGYECIYNVQMMEETQNIISVGAGAVTKTIDFENNRIERVFNIKDVSEYILRVDEMIERKRVMLND